MKVLNDWVVWWLTQFPECRGFLKRKVKEFLSHYYLKDTEDDNKVQGEEDEAIVNVDSLLYTPLNIQLGNWTIATLIVCVCACVCVCVCICACTCVFHCMYVCTCICMYVCTCICMYVCKSIHMYEYGYVCKHVYMWSSCTHSKSYTWSVMYEMLSCLIIP